MFNPVYPGNVVVDSTLNAWFDFGNPDCFLPAQGTGSITAGTLFYNLAPNYSTTTGSINGTVNWSPSFGGCMNLATTGNPQLSYVAGFSASFTTQVVMTCATDGNSALNFVSDGGAWPGYRPATDGFVFAQQYQSSPNWNSLIPVLWAGSSAATILNVEVPSSGWKEYMRFANVYTFKTNGSNSHSTYMNNIQKFTDTATRNRGNSPTGTIYLNRDPVLTRYGAGRIVAYLHYNRTLDDEEIYQNVQYYLNRFGTK